MTQEAVVATVDGKPLRAAFPLRVELFGIEAVVIPEAEYDELRARAAYSASEGRSVKAQEAAQRISARS